jgi:hypothetical protein
MYADTSLSWRVTMKYALLVALLAACAQTSSLGDGGRDSAIDMATAHANYKVAYAVPGGSLSIYHSRDGSVERWSSWDGFSIDAPNFGYRGDLMLVVRDMTTLNVLDSTGTLVRSQPRPGNVAPILQAVPRPDFSRFVAQSYDDAGTYVGTIDPDGGYNLLSKGGTFATYAPDGRTLFVAQYLGGNSTCMLMRDDGSSQTPMACTGGQFSFDGKQMVYVRTASPHAFISILDLTTLTSRDVGAPVESILNSPSFTPDGDAIVFVQQGQTTSTLQHLDIATGTVITLVPVMYSGYLFIQHISVAAEP